MRGNVSVTLPEEPLRAIDEIVGRGKSRSRVIEEAVIEHLERQRRAQRNARDLEIPNRHTDSTAGCRTLLTSQAKP